MHTRSHSVHTLLLPSTQCAHCLPPTQCVYTSGFYTVRTLSCLPCTQCVYTPGFYTVCTHSQSCLYISCTHFRLPRTQCVYFHTLHTHLLVSHTVCTLPACTQCAHTPGLHTVCTHSRSHTVPLARGAHTLAAAHLQSALAGTAPTARALSGPNKRLSRIRCTLHIPCARCRHSAAGDFL